MSKGSRCAGAFAAVLVMASAPLALGAPTVTATIVDYRFDNGTITGTLANRTYSEPGGTPATSAVGWDGNSQFHTLSGGAIHATNNSFVDESFLTGGFVSVPLNPNWIMEAVITPTGHQGTGNDQSEAMVINLQNVLRLSFLGDGSGTGTLVGKHGPGIGTTLVSTSADFVANDQPVHIGLIYRRQVAPMITDLVDLYVNGVLVSSATPAGPLNTNYQGASLLNDGQGFIKGFNGAMDAVNVRSFTGTATAADFVLPVPEPATTGLLLAAGGMLLARRRGRRCGA